MNLECDLSVWFLLVPADVMAHVWKSRDASLLVHLILWLKLDGGLVFLLLYELESSYQLSALKGINYERETG